MKKVTLSSFSILTIIISLFNACDAPKEKEKDVVVVDSTKNYIGSVGTDSVFEYHLKNGTGLQATILNYGGTITHLMTPDKNKQAADVVLGYDSLTGYTQRGNPYFGALVGRYANRIANATFTLDSVKYTLAPNDHGNTLHGGLKGFDKVIWTVDYLTDSSIGLSYLSKDGEEGFPGNLQARVVYTLTNTNELLIDYSAKSDKSTEINLTNHTYFNLSGNYKDSTILNEEISINAVKYTPVNEKLIPTGKLESVKNTPFDFIKSKVIGKDIDKVKGGYDHNWVLNKKDSFSLAATIYDITSGRVMEVWTTQPGLQFYTSNFLNGSLKYGKSGAKYGQHAAMCLETQHFPDSPNESGFPTTILAPGQAYHEVTAYRFSTK